MCVRNLISLLLALLLLSCNKDNVIIGPDTAPPEVSFDSEDGVYVVMLGNSVTVFSNVSNAESPVCRWVDDAGHTVSDYESLTFEATETGEFYFTFYCTAANGIASADIRIDVVETLLPLVSLPERLSVTVGEEIEVKPALANAEGASFRWLLDGEEVSGDPTFLFSSMQTGVFTLSLEVSNSEGSAEASVEITVVERPPLTVTFPAEEIVTCKGRAVYLSPEILGSLPSDTYSWDVDGLALPDETRPQLLFAPTAPGVYALSLTVTSASGQESKAGVRVKCLDVEEQALFRPATSSSSADRVKVFDFMPAPGQFIGRFTADNPSSACAQAETLVNAGEIVSLGNFGGYIVVGFDHSIPNGDLLAPTSLMSASGGSSAVAYDFGIAGNSFDTSNEPGIVYVMQDENGNGLPDDTWFELRGSQWDAPETWKDYSVTYYRPSSAGMPVVWSDNRNSTGTVEPSPYWPAWQNADSYTLSGTRLKETARKEYGMWKNDPYPWGYADNLGSDIVSGGANSSGGRNFNGFRIANAVYPDGTPANLLFIDFVKVQTGVLFNAGVLGEVSTEVAGFVDYSMQ